MQATVSEMVGGWKGLLLSPLDSYLKKDGVGTEVPIHIRGTREQPQFGIDFDRIKLERAESYWLSSLSFFALYALAYASGGTAPPSFFSAWLATNSPQSDHRSTQLVRLVSLSIRLGLPPSGAGSRAAAVTLKSSGSSFPHIPSSSGLARLHPSLPRVPVALSCRTERYDGKRDLHLQHAA